MKLLKYFTILLVISVFACKDATPNLPDPLEAGWNNEAVCEVVEDNASLRVLKCTFPPGVGHEKHYHKPHTGYTLVGGTFKIEDAKGTRTVTIPDGYSFSKDSITQHQVQNVGETTAVFLIMEYR